MKNPFTQAREIIKLQQEAAKMQKKLRATIVSGNSRGELVSLTMNGAQELVELAVSDSLLSIEKKGELLKSIKEAYKDAQNKLQKEMMKDVDMDRIKGMLGM